MGYNIISGDSHIDLRFMPEELFVANASAGMVDKMPHVVETGKGRRWNAGGVDLGVVGHEVDPRTFSTEMGTRWNAMISAGFYEDADQGYHPTNPDLRIKDQDKDGIDAEVIYGLLRISHTLNDNDQVVEIFRIYNDWLAGLLQEPSRSLRRVGLHSQPQPAGRRRRASPRREHRPPRRRLWRGRSRQAYLSSRLGHALGSLHDTGLSISFHTTGLRPRAVDASEASQYDEVYHNVRTTMFQLQGAEFVTSIIFSGACERYPNFKFVLGECGVSWIPYVIDRMDHEGEGQSGISMLPSEYWNRQGFSTFQKENVAGHLIHLVGEGNVIWGSDYPHQDGVWPDSLQTIEDNLRDLKNPSAKQKVIRDNSAALYGFQL